MRDSGQGQTAGSEAPPGPYEIAFVSSHARQGGSERYLATVLESLGPAWTKEVVVLEDGPFAEELKGITDRLRIVPTSARPWGILRSAWRLRRLLRRSRPDLVHANGVKAALVSVLATAGTRVPVIWIKHDVSWDGWLSRLVAARCARIVAVSGYVASAFSARARRKVNVVHNGIEPVSPDRSEGRRRLLEAISAAEPLKAVCLVGRLDPAKGHGELLAVGPRLRSRFAELEIVFIGGEDPVYPGYGAVLAQQAGDLGIGDHVHFLGYRDDAKLLIAGCDALVIASFANERGLGREAFAYVGLEALVAGTPVVAYADGGIPELLGDCGVLLAPGDRDGLSRELTRLFLDDEERSRVARCGQKRVSSTLSLERSLLALTYAYSEALGETVGSDSLER